MFQFEAQIQQSSLCDRSAHGCRCSIASGSEVLSHGFLCCLFLDFYPVFAQRMTQMEGFADWWKEQVIERGKQQEKHWMAAMKNAVSE